MPNGHGEKQYGGHKYDDDHDHTSDCHYACGCFMGPCKSGGPAGLDPFGACPGNPMDGKPLGGQQDYDYVVNERIKKLESRANTAEAALQRVDPTKKELAKKIILLEKEIAEAKRTLNEIQRVMTSAQGAQ